MKQHFWIFLFSLITSFGCYADTYFETHSLEDAVLDFNHLNLELNKILSSAKSYCEIGFKVSSDGKCHLLNYCEKFKDNVDRPFVLSTSTGEKIVNEKYFDESKTLVACLKDNFQDEIAAKLEDYKKENKKANLKTIYDLNQKLKLSLKKNNEYNQYSQINQEIISMRLQDGMNDRESPSLKNLILLASTKLKIKLSNESTNLLVKIEQETNNENYLKDQSAFEKKIFNAGTPDDLFYNLGKCINENEAGSKEKLIANQKIYIKKANEVLGTFEESRSAMLEYLTSLKNKQNEKEINRAIERVKLVKFRTPVLSDDFLKACEFPNAWYTSGNNTITICPQWFNRPKILNFEVFSHELSHSIDPCNLSAPFKIKSSVADEVETGYFDLNLKLPELKQSQTMYGNIDNSDLKSTDQVGLVTSKNPFSKMIKCLQGSDSIGAVVPDRAAILKKLDDELNYLKSTNQKKTTNSHYNYLVSARDHFDEYYNLYGLCNNNSRSGLSQIEESFADKMASELVERKLSKISNSSAKNELETLMLGNLNTNDALCENGPAISKIRNTGINMGCKNYFENQDLNMKVGVGLLKGSEAHMNSHPNLVDRIDKIILANPKIKEILGCQNKGAKYCEN